MKFRNGGPVNRLLFYCVKLPGIYFLMVAGILFEFIIQLPFIIICSLENLFHTRTDSEEKITS
ncbi:hypothetical protein D1AOALGA4SA_582 [Olavius algarvensis Delta 1 endosymbiont]|nr:hypothetical protein D1AOALGA4SA_582 [Olavius algarvensis Delta 1 endosymbiont]